MGNFSFEKTYIDGLVIVSSKIFGDERGYFVETYNSSDFYNAGLKYEFVQDNQSKSRQGVLRGLHFQKEHPQSKLVRVITGSVFDVAVDLRKDSPTFGKWYGLILSEDNKLQLLIPRGFAHGFLVLSNEATFCYKCDNLYHPDDEGGIMWNDNDVGIKWPHVDNICLSEKDKHRQSLKEYQKGLERV